MDYELIYHSCASENITPQDITTIVRKGYVSNKAKNISGCLLVYYEEFSQILEGEKDEVLALYKHIAKDSRHHNPTIVHQGEISKRLFSSYTMAYRVILALDIIELKDEMGVEEYEPILTTLQRPDLAKKLFGNVIHAVIHPEHIENQLSLK